MHHREKICALIIILFHLVGLYGFLNPGLTNLFLKLVPLHLLLMLMLLIISGYDGSSQLLLFALIIYICGFLIEVAGVNTGLIFGSYTYGRTLGTKIWDTPLLIGVNWLVLVYSTGIFLSLFRLNKYVLPVVGAVILVATDYLIEPVATRYDYWSWAGNEIPLKNYLGWFIVSFILFILFQNFGFRKQNSAAIAHFVAQICFFLILNTWAT